MANHAYYTVVCDGCGKVLMTKDYRSGQEANWWSVAVNTPMFDKGAFVDDRVSLDFCSFECLRKWANEQGKEATND